MAKDIEFFPNAVAPSADYPNGDVKDTPSGTPVNAETTGDMWQFFRKLMREAGITPNNLRDNTTNGWQLFDALQIAAKPYDVYVVTLSQAGVANPTENTNHTNELSGLISWTRSGVGTYAGTLVGAFPIGKVFTISNITTLGMNHASVSRFDDDNLVLFTYDNAGALSDAWTMQLEIRVYR